MSDYTPAIPGNRDEALRALGTADAELRRLVVRALEQAPVDLARELLPVVLGDDDWRVRKEGIQLVHALSERADVVPILVAALRAPSDQVALRNAAVEALSALGAAAAPALEHALVSGGLDADGRKLAVDALGGARQPRSVPVLIDALGDVDPNVRYAAAEALGLLGGPDAVDALAAMLGREDRYLRLVALEGLNRLGAVVPEVILRGFLTDKILRHAAVAALGRTGDPDAIAALIGALDDGSRHVAETALRSLSTLLFEDAEASLAARGHAARATESARRRVLNAADASDLALRRAAIPVLALFADAEHTAETDALLRALRDPDVAEEAEAALARLGSSIAPALIDVARRGEVPSRAAALAALPRVAERSAEAVEVLREGLRDPDRTIVAAAAQAFAAALSFGVVPNAADVHALLRVAGGRDASPGTSSAKAAAVALQSLRTLARVRPDAVRPHLAHIDVGDDEAPVVCALLAVAGGPEHVAWLSRATTAPSARTRRAAVEALGQIGGAAAADALGYAVTDESNDVALAAIKALGRLRDEQGRGVGASALLRLIDAGGDEAILAAAVRAVGQSGDERAAVALRPLTTSPRIPVACAALEALADLGVDREVIVAALSHPASVVARTALDVLDTALDERDMSLLAELTVSLGHASWEVRRRAVEVVGRLDPLTVRPLLASRVAIESEPMVREALDRAIVELDRRVARPSRPPPPSDLPEGAS